MNYTPTIVRTMLLRPYTVQSFYRALSVASSGRRARNKSKDGPTEVRIPKELQGYFATRDSSVLDRFPITLLKKCSSATRYYLADEESAKVVADIITRDLPSKRLLVEVNPGLGFITQALVKKQIRKLLLFEADSNFEENLQRILAPVGGKLRIADFNGIGNLAYADICDNGNRVQDLLQNLPRSKWKDDVCCRLFSVVDCPRFFKYLMHSISHQIGWSTVGRFEMFLLMSPLVYARLAATREGGYKLYRASTFLFQLFFEHELLQSIPRKHILPWPSNAFTKKTVTMSRKLLIQGMEEWYLVKVVPRRDLFDHCLPDNLKLLDFFITQHCVSRRNRVIPTLERWIPYCGARLILHQNYVDRRTTKQSDPEEPPPITLAKSLPLLANDSLGQINIYTEFGELTPSQMMSLFNEFISWPEFPQSAFIQTMESQKLKRRPLQPETGDDDDDDDHALDDAR